jgi:hypothetical protein
MCDGCFFDRANLPRSRTPAFTWMANLLREWHAAEDEAERRGRQPWGERRRVCRRAAMSARCRAARTRFTSAMPRGRGGGSRVNGIWLRTSP